MTRRNDDGKRDRSGDRAERDDARQRSKDGTLGYVKDPRALNVALRVPLPRRGGGAGDGDDRDDGNG